MNETESLLDRPARAVFFDGHTARRRQVVVTLEPQAIRIHEPDAAGADTCWPLAELRWITAPGAEETTLGHEDHPDARLVFPHADWLTAFRHRHPEVFRSARRRRRNLKAAATVVALLIAVIAAAIWAVPASAPVIAAMTPQAWQEQMGDSAVELFARMGPLCTGRDGEQVLQALSERLLAGSEIPPVKVVVLDIPHENAFAAPGGRLVIFRGLLDKAGSPAEVAGILAHEMGHHIEDHALQNLIRHSGIAILADALTGGSGLIGAVAGVGGLAVAMSYQRDDERAADEWAVRILRRAGISSEGLVDFFERHAEIMEEVGLEGKKDGGSAFDQAVWTAVNYLSSHPPSAERLRFFAEHRVEADQPALDARAWKELRSICSSTRSTL